MHTIDNGIKENFFNYEGRLNRKRYSATLRCSASVLHFTSSS